MLQQNIQSHESLVAERDQLNSELQRLEQKREDLNKEIEKTKGDIKAEEETIKKLREQREGDKKTEQEIANEIMLIGLDIDQIKVDQAEKSNELQNLNNDLRDKRNQLREEERQLRIQEGIHTKLNFEIDRCNRQINDDEHEKRDVEQQCQNAQEMESAEEQFIKRLHEELRNCKDYYVTRSRFSWNPFKGFSEEY